LLVEEWVAMAYYLGWRSGEFATLFGRAGGGQPVAAEREPVVGRPWLET
jgi:hypothetical protein